MSGRALLLLIALFAWALPASAQDRVLLVRGRVMDAGGAAVVGARVSARGTVTLSAMTDERGRYALTVPLGRPLSLARTPFTLEVRVDHRGRRVPFAIQGSAFALEMTLVPGETPVARVRSNAPSAALAVAAAMLSPAAPQAVVDADFGGAALGGAIEMSASEDVPLPELAGRMPARSAPPARPAGRASPTESSRRAEEQRSARAERDSIRRVASSRRITSGPRDTAATPRVMPHASAPRVTAPRSSTAEQRLRETSALGTRASVSVRDSLAEPPAAAGRIRRVEPQATPPQAPAPVSASSPDSCMCQVRGTVEVQWERPLEQDLPVLVVLDGPVRAGTQVELFIGSPREFRFGPLPCGTYRVTVETLGRGRYRVVRGDGELECLRTTQQRIVLAPTRR